MILPRRAGRVAGGLLLITACLLLAVYFPEISYRSRTLDRLHDLAHLPLFFLVAIIMMAIWPGGIFIEERLRPLPALRLWLAALLAGMLVELLQARQGRIPEMMDIVTDGAGAAIAILMASGYRGGLWRWTLPPALALALAFATPVFLSAWDEALARRQFPLLADLETTLQVDRFGPSHSRLRRITDPESAANHLLEVRFLPDMFPRFKLRDLPRDWSEFSAFTFTCINPGAEPFTLIVRVDDIHHDNRPADRYTLRIKLEPGRHLIEVSLAAVAKAPDTRPMDMTAIAGVIFYGYKIETPRTLLFDDFRLVP